MRPSTMAPEARGSVSVDVHRLVKFLSESLLRYTNCAISLQERQLPTPLRQTGIQRVFWNWTTLPLQNFCFNSQNL